MKQLLLFITLLLCLNLFSQKFEQETIKPTTSVVTGDWAHRADLGLSFMLVDNQTVFYNASPTLSYSAFRKNIIFNANLQSRIKYSDSIYNYQCFSLGIGLGYNYDFSQKWGAYGIARVHASNYSCIMKNDVTATNIATTTGNYLGCTFNIGLNRYIKLGTRKYLAISPNISYYSNLKFFRFSSYEYEGAYKYINEYLDQSNGYFVFSFSIAYKGFTSKRVD